MTGASYWSAMRARWRWGQARSEKTCGLPGMSGAVALADDGSVDTYRCDSAWSCPRCGPRIRAERAREIEGVAVRCEGAAMVTLTVPHLEADSLQDLFGAVTAAWRRITSGRGAWSYPMWVRATEVTWGTGGWHPHIHVIVMGREHDAMRAARGLVARWLAVSPDSRPAAQHVAPWKSGVGGDYISKVALEASVPHGDTVRGRLDGRLLWHAVAAGRSGAVDAAREFASVTRGRKWVTWSRSLRELRQEVREVMAVEDSLLEDDRRYVLVSAQDLRRYLLAGGDPADLVAMVPAYLWTDSEGLKRLTPLRL